MKRADRDRRVRIIMASAVVLAAPALLLAPRTARADTVRTCGCVVNASCPRADESDDDEPDEPDESQEPDEKGEQEEPDEQEEPESDSAEAAERHRDSAVPISVDDGGLALKLSFYRGLGGGVTASFTRDALTLTFEGGAGVGGSFSAGSAMGRPDPGLSFEARASTSSRMRFVNPPDFGLTLSRDARLQAYMDVKTAQYRTRFRSRAVSLTDMVAEESSEVPMTRRSWSLGTEFKVASAYTIEIPGGRFLDVWHRIFDLAPGGSGDTPPSRPMRSAERNGSVAVLARAALKRPIARRRRGVGRRAPLADRFLLPKAARVLRAPVTGRRVRAVRSRASASSARRARTGPRDGRTPAAPADEEHAAPAPP